MKPAGDTDEVMEDPCRYKLPALYVDGQPLPSPTIGQNLPGATLHLAGKLRKRSASR
jgi:hypothetical protein